MAQDKLDFFDTWDLYAQNPRSDLYASPERNLRHHSISYEIGAALKHAGCLMDFECKRVRNGEYTPDGVAMMRVATLTSHEQDGKKCYDIGLTDEVMKYILETNTSWHCLAGFW